MLESDLSSIFTALQQAEVRYLVVGGLAVIAHGHARGTADLDLVVALDQENASKAIQTLCSLGYRPLAPVPAGSFAIEEVRRSWVEEKGMRVFQMISDLHPNTSVDLFVAIPFDFSAEYSRSPRMELLPGLPVPIVSYEALLAMKRQAGRPRDLDDLANLELSRRDTGSAETEK
jgi:hypothetical protein